MTASPRKQKYTIKEYIELLKNSDERFEYFDGEIISMAAGKISHGAIAMNLGRSLGNSLADRPCQVFGGDTAIKTVKEPPFRLPDVSVVCGEPVIEELYGMEMLVNPVMIAEVLSKTLRNMTAKASSWSTARLKASRNTCLSSSIAHTSLAMCANRIINGCGATLSG